LELLERCQFPGTGDRKKLRASYAKVLALKERMPDLVLLPAHDPGAAEALREATSTRLGVSPDSQKQHREGES
jgi:glyoxylase-like metal-dependent hydrolase (beta-lactamase superfamily II)